MYASMVCISIGAKLSSILFPFGRPLGFGGFQEIAQNFYAIPDALYNKSIKHSHAHKDITEKHRKSCE